MATLGTADSIRDPNTKPMSPDDLLEDSPPYGTRRDSSNLLQQGASSDSEADKEDDSSSFGDSIRKSKCLAFGGRVPSGNYDGLTIDAEDEKIMEVFYDEARRYCDEVQLMTTYDVLELPPST